MKLLSNQAKSIKLSTSFMRKNIADAKTSILTPKPINDIASLYGRNGISKPLPHIQTEKPKSSETKDEG